MKSSLAILIITITAGYSTESLIAASNHQLGVSEHLNKLFAIHETQDVDALWAEYYSIPNTHNLSASQANAWNLLQEYLALEQNAHLAGRDISSLNAQEITELIGMAENPEGGLTSVWASNALCFHYSICKDGAPTNSEESEPKSIYGTEENEPSTSVFLIEKARAFPNPAQDYLTIVAAKGKLIKRFEVFDLSGRLTQSGSRNDTQMLLLEQLVPGVALVRLHYSDGTVESLRVIIIQ